MNNKTQKKKWLNSFTLNFISICLVLALFLTGCASPKTDNHINNSITITPESNPEETKSTNENSDAPNEIPGNSNTDKTVGDQTSNEEVIEEDNEQTVPTKPISLTLEQRINQTLSDMSLKEKVAQIFLITPEALTGYKKVTKTGNVTRNALRTYPVGGLIYFSSNIVTPKQLKTMTTKVQKYAEDIDGLPLFLAIDEEGGTVARIGNNPNFKVKKYSDMASIGAVKDFVGAYKVGDTIGAYLHEYGFNLDFAPDADVLTNPNNKVIGNRSFGIDGNLVAKMDLEVAKGLADNQILSCFKHFPGHGATEGDTHEGFAFTNRTLEQMKKSELVPFQAAVDHDIPFIMISHISAPKVIGNNTPASLSKVMITDLLRNQMGYDGIIITDSMSMGAIVIKYGPKEAVILSIKAGADMILMPQDFKDAYQGVLDAVAKGQISEKRINQSVERILRVKLSMRKD